MNITISRAWLLASAASLAMCNAVPANAAGSDVAAESGADATQIANSDDIIVTATKVNNETPITASVHTFEPQAIVSRSIIENSIAPTADFSQVLLLTPGASLVPSSGNGVGLGDQKITLRGFKDGQYNMTYDGVPFGDTNSPSHHSTSYFPNGTYDRIIVDRGPGAATDLGQASYGGNVHLISREATDHRFIEGQAVYGSFKTAMGRLTINTGTLDKLGGLKIIAVGEYKRTDGALSNQSGWWANGFIKAVKPLGENAELTFLANYNQSLFHQSDSAAGATAAQIARYGRQFGATTPETAAGSLYPNARNDWNWQNKTSDMEIARLTFRLASNVTIDNKVYTYFYKNFTLSTDDSTTQCNVLSAADQCTGSAASPNGAVFATAKASGKGLGGSGGTAIAGDIAGYTKLNQFRTSGDILQVTVDTRAGILKVGGWFERSQSRRATYDYDFTTGSRAGGIGNYNFNFAIMNNGANWNWKEKDTAANIMLNGGAVPAYIKYDERTSWDQIQGFGEFALKLLDDTLTITPGVKVQNFTRKINTPIAAQTTRLGIQSSQSFSPTLPYATVNYLIRPNFSTYAQYAKGFIIPGLSTSLQTLSSGSKVNQPVPLVPTPTKTKNFQAGFVYAGERLNIDADIYYIEASNSTYTDPGNSNTVVQNGDPAHYKGVEAQVSYLIMPGLTAISNGTLMSSKDATTGLWLQAAPNYTALLGAVYNTGRLKLSYLHKFTGRQWVDALNKASLAPYSYGVFSGSMTFGAITAGVTVNNPLNSHPITAQSGLPSAASTLYIFQAPAAYEAQLKVRF
jgi:iron complex outermembrane receptor protein